jgi:hypothetical protein
MLFSFTLLSRLITITWPSQKEHRRHLKWNKVHGAKSFWEAKSFSTSQQIHRILWNPKVHYRTHKRQQTLSILSQSNPVHASPSHYLKIHFNITLPFTTRFSKWSPSLKSPHQNPTCTSPVSHTCYMPRPSHSSWSIQPKYIWWGIQSIKPLIILSSSFPLSSRPS